MQVALHWNHGLSAHELRFDRRPVLRLHLIPFGVYQWRRMDIVRGRIAVKNDQCLFDLKSQHTWCELASLLVEDGIGRGNLKGKFGEIAAFQVYEGIAQSSLSHNEILCPRILGEWGTICVARHIDSLSNRRVTIKTNPSVHF